MSAENCRIKDIPVCGCEVCNTAKDSDYGAGAGIVAKGYVQDAVTEYNNIQIPRCINVRQWEATEALRCRVDKNSYLLQHLQKYATGCDTNL